MSTKKKVVKKVKKVVNYSLVIEPALMPEERHKIEAVLEAMGYEVSGGGTMCDMSVCDISFEK